MQDAAPKSGLWRSEDKYLNRYKSNHSTVTFIISRWYVKLKNDETEKSQGTVDSRNGAVYTILIAPEINDTNLEQRTVRTYNNFYMK